MPEPDSQGVPPSPQFSPHWRWIHGYCAFTHLCCGFQLLGTRHNQFPSFAVASHPCHIPSFTSTNAAFVRPEKSMPDGSRESEPAIFTAGRSAI